MKWKEVKVVMDVRTKLLDVRISRNEVREGKRGARNWVWTLHWKGLH